MIDWAAEAEKANRKGEYWTNGDKKLFIRYAEDARRQVSPTISDVRIRKYHIYWGTLIKTTGRPISENIASMGALERAVKEIIDSKLMPATKKDGIKLMGSVYNFQHNEERSLKYADRKLKKMVAYRPKENERVARLDVMNREEIREMVQQGSTLDKALVFTLFESGCRIGEFLALRRKDVRMIKEGASIFIPSGKTGERWVLVVEAATYLGRWLDEHPIRREDAHLWVSPTRSEPYTIQAVAKRIKRLVRLMNEHRKAQGTPLFDKPHHRHAFRHARASELGAAPGMSESILNDYMGWAPGSKTSGVYLHLNPEKIKNAILGTYGKAKLEETTIITHRTCLRCKQDNPIGLNYCGRCGANMESGKVISNIMQLQERVAKLEKALIRKAGAKLRRG